MIRTALEKTFSVIQYSNCLLYTHETMPEVLNQGFLMRHEYSLFRRQLHFWGERFADEDLSNLEREGITRDTIIKVRDLAKSLSKKIFLPIEKDNSLSKLSLFFYKDQANSIKEISDQLKQIYEDCQSDLKYQLYIIEKDLDGQGDDESIIHIPNPLYSIPDIIENVCSNIDEILNNDEKISTKSFIFSPEFEILKTFSDDIQDKKFKETEMKELSSIYSLLVVKGFILNQVKIKLTEKEKIAYRNERYFRGNDDELQKISEYENLDNFFSLIYKNLPDINEEALNKIYQNHQNDEAGNILKPLFEQLIPFYKSLDCQEGFINLTFSVTEYYRKNANSFIKSFCYNELPVSGIYLDQIKYKLIDAPEESY